MARSRRVFYLYCNDKQTFLNRKYEFARISKYKGSWKQIHTILSHYEHLIPYRLDYHIPVDLSFVSSLDVIEVDQLTLTKKIFKLEDLLHERRRERVIYRLYGWQVVRAYTKAKSTAVFRYIVSFPYNGPSYQIFSDARKFLKGLDIKHKIHYIYTSRVFLFADPEHAMLCRLSFADDIKNVFDLVTLAELPVVENSAKH